MRCGGLVLLISELWFLLAPHELPDQLRPDAPLSFTGLFVGWLPAAVVYGVDSWSNQWVLRFDLRSLFNFSNPIFGNLAFAPAGQRALELLLGAGSTLDYIGTLFDLQQQLDLPFEVEVF